MYIAVYGSLRKGFHNHHWLGIDPKFIGTDAILGQMYLCGAYPHFRPDPEGRSYKIEIYDIPEYVLDGIKRGEESCGYEQKEIQTRHGQAFAFFTRPDYDITGLEPIQSYTIKLIRSKRPGYMRNTRR